MSSGASVNALQRLVEQLKLEAGVERIKVRRRERPFLGARRRPAPAPPAVPGPQGEAAGDPGRLAAEPAERERGGPAPGERPRRAGRRRGSDAVGGREDCAPGPGSLRGLAGVRARAGPSRGRAPGGVGTWARGEAGPAWWARGEGPVPAGVVRGRVPRGLFIFSDVDSDPGAEGSRTDPRGPVTQGALGWPGLRGCAKMESRDAEAAE